MALKDKISLGVALPHRSPEPVDITSVRHIAQRAEALGFRDLWVTENTLDHVFCFDPVVVLTYAAAVTNRIRLGASVVVMAVHSPLMIAHQWACLDYASNGRAILGVGLGREHHYRQFEVLEDGRLTRFRDRKSTRLNSSHLVISYAVFCLKKKKKNYILYYLTQKKKPTIHSL